MKICLNCREEKEITNFTKDSSKKDKLNNYCKICNKARKDKWDSENKERTREYGIRYNRENRIIDKEKMKDYKKKYYMTICNLGHRSYNTNIISRNRGRYIKIKSLYKFTTTMLIY